MEIQSVRWKACIVIRLNILVEGRTEETFVRDVLSPALFSAGIIATPRMPPTSKFGRGGGSSFLPWRRTVLHWLLQDQTAYLTTMFDVYGLPSDFPRLQDSLEINDIYQRADFLETCFRDSIAAEAPNAQRRFVPYLQMHEFEGLLFTDLKEMEALEPDWSGYALKCTAEAARFATPEHVNNSVHTAPSKRLTKHFVSPCYIKPLHGVLAAQAIGLNRIRSQCKRFDAWLNCLIELSQTTT